MSEACRVFGLVLGSFHHRPSLACLLPLTSYPGALPPPPRPPHLFPSVPSPFPFPPSPSQGLALGLEYSKQVIETASAAAPAVVASL